MNHRPQNKTIYTDEGRAELFFQTVNLDHYLMRYLQDLNKSDEKRFHRLTFREITKALNKDDTLIQKYTDAKKKYFAIAYYEGRYYYIVFYLERRDDCDKLFAIIVTCYATNNKDIHKRHQIHVQNLEARFRR